MSYPATRTFTTGLTKKALDFLLPPRCILSGQPVARQGLVAPDVWATLDFISDPLCKVCGVPFEFTDQTGAVCVSCLDDPPEFECARAALIYNEHSRPLILRFKHADQTIAAQCFTPWLLRAGQALLDQADLLVPVPLHPMRLLKRRYNQAALIARELSHATQLPWHHDVLRRVRHTASQGVMSSPQRRGNVRSAFAVPPHRRTLIEGKHLCLIDDVYTTGATVRECTRTLLDAGAEKVSVLCVARVKRHR